MTEQPRSPRNDAAARRPSAPKFYGAVAGGYVALFLLAQLVPSCFTNNPYPHRDATANVFYSTFGGEPKYLDPARSYSSDEYRFLELIYEPPLQYHYLKRPYRLIPATVEAVPEPRYYDGYGNELPKDAPPGRIARAAYELKIEPGVRFQDHPCFARGADGSYTWHLGPEDAFPGIDHPCELPGAAHRTLRAEDYAYQIKRLAHPLLQCPIFPIMARYVVGYEEYAEHLSREVAKLRAARREAAGAFYNQERDEAANPLYIDLRAHDFPGVEVVDELTLRINLKRKYPQMKYWLAMPFFAPVPWEADRFYTQAAAVAQDITFNRFPVGTGPYTLSFNQPNWRIELARNPNFAGRETYPTEGEAGDEAAGLLVDAGEEIPFIDHIVYVMEKESIPRWSKFLQGYYDTSGVGSDIFDWVVNVSAEGSQLTEFMKSKSIRLVTSPAQTTGYYAFNMLDDVVGGLDEKRRKLRQAISIAFDIEEYIQIFLNDRGLVAHGPIPPGIAGHASGREFNPVTHVWDEAAGRPRRRGLDEAKRLLAEAGYPGGVGPDGKPLVLYFDASGSGNKARMDWLRKQFAKLEIQLQIRSTDYNQFRSKVSQGNYQFLSWGWYADYPDPENFMFLLYGPNGKVASQGENASNYDSPRFDELFEKMENMEDSPERAAIIREMNAVLREDAPWIWGLHSVSYGLYHEWLRNAKPTEASRGSLKYHRIDAELRARRRREWNRPVTWPLWLGLALVSGPLLPAVLRAIRKRREEDAA